MRRISPALAVALLALVIALVGGGAAAVAGGAYLITSSKQIKPGAVKTQNLSKKAVKDLSGASGPAGPAGPAGAAGATGATGQRGPSDAWFIQGQAEAKGVTVPPGSYVASGTVYIETSGPATCTLWRRTVGSSGSSGNRFFAGATGQITLTVGRALVLTQPTVVWVDCSGTGSGTWQPSVSLLAVGNLVQGPA